jgi:LacI family transcriptional regulator
MRRERVCLRPDAVKSDKRRKLAIELFMPHTEKPVKKSPRRRSNAVTMHEVAKYVGVSPMTVSRVLSGDAIVRTETRERVQAAIERLGYSPDVAARNLAKASTVQIGLVYNNPSSA